METKMFEISKEFEFSAAHQLPHLGDQHPCARLHGHNYTITLHLYAQCLTGNSMVVDYRELDEFKKWVDNTLDHVNLNDVFKVHTTAENIALYVFLEWQPKLPKLFKVTVSETRKTKASYEINR